jgi:hypothetical protein
MVFLYNALQHGWCVYKKDNCYIFKKKHEGLQEVFEESYLSTFIKENCTIDNSFLKQES